MRTLGWSELEAVLELDTCVVLGALKCGALVTAEVTECAVVVELDWGSGETEVAAGLAGEA